MAWSTPADVLGKLRRSWDSGDFLARFAGGECWTPLVIGIQGPTARELVDRFGDAHAWADRWRAAARRGMTVEFRNIGSRVAGANEVPSRVIVGSYDELWGLLGVRREIRQFTDLLAATRDRAPRIAEWMATRPREVFKVAGDWERLLDTVLWIDERANSTMYLRQVDVPGVDTKFIENHRRVLAAMLDQQLDAHRIDRDQPPSDFAGRYRFRRKPDYVRFRWLGDRSGYSGFSGFSELSVRVDELAVTALPVSTVFILENEVTYLAFPEVPRSIVVFGGGYAVSRLRRLPWLADRRLYYWGDIDTHGFAILNRLRGAFAHARSMLMDRETLLAHEGQWIREKEPVTEHLQLLAPDEAALYNDLVEDAIGPSLRLEQERISYSAVERAVHSLL